MARCALALLTFAGAPLLGASKDGFQDPSAMPRPSVRALAIDGSIQVDGLFDEAVWQQAEIATGFIQQQPDEGVEASQPTEFRVVYSRSTLYFALDAIDSEPDKIVAKEMGRDARLFSEDSIRVMIDTFHDRRNSFGFETNPNGAKFDALITDEGRDFNSQWDGVWNVAARRTSRGWQAEMAIPFSTLRFNPQQSTWGLQVRRSIARRNEDTYWSPLPRGVFFRISMAGELTGLDGLKPSRQLDIKPFVIGNAGKTAEDGSSEDLDTGLDVKWGVTKSMRLDLTYNTDFAEVEVDEQRVNLTRFSLFFPEKREFFLENAGIFEFGPGGGGFGFRRRTPLLKVFFSRRIGIDDDGAPVPVDWGARLTGRVGGWNFGVLDVKAERTEAVGKTNFAVVRAKRNLGQRSSLGMIYTDRSERGATTNRVFGLDIDYNPTQKINVNGHFAQSDDDSLDGDDWAGGAGFRYDGRSLEASLDVAQISEDFEPGIGFLLRRNVIRYKPSIEYQPIINKGIVRTLSFRFNTEYISTIEGLMESRTHELDLIGFRTYRGDSLSFRVEEQTERLFDPFEISDGIVIPIGRYDFDPRWGFRLSTSGSRPVGVRASWNTGGFYGGTNERTSATLSLRPSKYFQSETGIQLNDVELPQGAFEGNVFSQRFAAAFSPRLLIDGLLQYNEAAEELGLNLRFNWIYKPGADLFVVFNQRWLAPSLGDLVTEDRQVIVKFTYLFQI